MLDRRRFLKLGMAASAAATGLRALPAQGVGPTLHVSRTTHKADLPTSTTCRMCPAACGISAYTRNERLITLMGNPQSALGQGRICAVGLAAINLHYLPDRITSPLKRVGPRGSGKFEPISWAEAVNTLGSALAQSKGTLVHSEAMDDRIPAPLAAFQRALPGSKLVSLGTSRRRALDFAAQQAFGLAPPVADLVRARSILCVGANPFEGGRRYIQDAMQIAQARVERGAKLIVIDPRLSNTAGRADIWLPVRPGGDRLLLAALARELVGLGRIDASLVSLCDVDPARHAQWPTAEQAEQDLGLSAGSVAATARSIADNLPLSVLVADSVAARPDGDQAAAAAWALAALVGAIDAEGGLTFPETFGQGETAQPSDPLQAYSELLDGGGALLLHCANPVYDLPQGAQLGRALADQQRVGMIAAVTPFLNESSMLADIVLPEALPLECNDMLSVACGSTPLMALQRRAVEPMGVALPLRDALNMLCEQSDLGPLLRGLQIEPEAQWFEATLE
ncbi:MAG: molybdopterin-dependent oxidoreductase, partial [Candidatus Alcyoniella australis]|nr:molybdopterin-dependent oxidoreductase [Candidatus Alcyoniella australis]